MGEPEIGVGLDLDGAALGERSLKLLADGEEGAARLAVAVGCELTRCLCDPSMLVSGAARVPFSQGKVMEHTPKKGGCQTRKGPLYGITESAPFKFTRRQNFRAKDYALCSPTVCRSRVVIGTQIKSGMEPNGVKIRMRGAKLEQLESVLQGE